MNRGQFQGRMQGRGGFGIVLGGKRQALLQVPQALPAERQILQSLTQLALEAGEKLEPGRNHILDQALAGKGRQVVHEDSQLPS